MCEQSVTAGVGVAGMKLDPTDPLPYGTRPVPYPPPLPLDLCPSLPLTLTHCIADCWSGESVVPLRKVPRRQLGRIPDVSCDGWL